MYQYFTRKALGGWYLNVNITTVNIYSGGSRTKQRKFQTILKLGDYVNSVCNSNNLRVQMLAIQQKYYSHENNYVTLRYRIAGNFVGAHFFYEYIYPFNLNIIQL